MLAARNLARYHALTMKSGEFPRLKLNAVLLESTRICWQRRGALALILLAPAATAAAVGIFGMSAIMGLASEHSYVDLSTVTITLTDIQRAGMAMGGFVNAVVLSLALAATIHAAAGAERVPAWQAFARLRGRGLQLFWLQCVVLALTLRFAPWAGLLMWVLIGCGNAVAILENLGPSDAMDRAWALSKGNRLRLLSLEILMLAPLVAVLFAVGYLFLVPGRSWNLNAISPWIRLVTTPLLAGTLLAPIQLLFVVRTRAYEHLRRDREPRHLHAQAASSVI